MTIPSVVQLPAAIDIEGLRIRGCGAFIFTAIIARVVSGEPRKKMQVHRQRRSCLTPICRSPHSAKTKTARSTYQTTRPAPERFIAYPKFSLHPLQMSPAMAAAAAVASSLLQLNDSNYTRRPVYMRIQLSSGRLKWRCNKTAKGSRKKTSHFMRRSISSSCVAKARNIQIFLRFRALLEGRLNA